MDTQKYAVPMSNNELLVLSLLKDRSKNNALPNHEIQAKTGLGERRIRKIVQHLILDHRQPIGSSSSSAKGYYWINDIKEMESNFRKLRSRALIILKRAATIKHIGMDEMLDQIKIDLDGGN